MLLDYVYLNIFKNTIKFSYSLSELSIAIQICYASACSNIKGCNTKINYRKTFFGIFW